MKVFVTGATSSIGVYLVKYLLDKKYTIHILTRSSRKLPFQSPDIVYFKGEINNISTIMSAMQDCEQVYHLAANAKVWLKNPSEYFETNVKGTQNVLKVAYLLGVKKIVVTSSAGSFGPSISGMVDEHKTREVDFFNEYESSKALMELRVKEFVLEKSMNIVIVSPTRVYGPVLVGPESSVTLLFKKFLFDNWRIIPGSGKEIGNYAFVKDVALGHIQAMERGKSGQTYILGGENCTYFDLFDQLKKLAGINRKMFVTPFWIQKQIAYFQLLKANGFNIEPKITPKWIAKGKFNWEVSSQKAMNELGYCITPLNQGIQETIEFLRDKNH